MKFLVSIFVLASAVSAMANSPEVYMTTGSDVIKSAQKHMNSAVEVIDVKNGIAILKVNANKTLHMSHMMHEDFHRCGGYVVHESLEEAKAALNNTAVREYASKGLFELYEIDQTEKVEPMVDLVQEEKIRATITKLSSFKNRFYKSKYGQNSQAWLKAHWEELTQNRSDASVEFFQHSAWPQPSVIATIKGSDRADEVIVIGGHADSISGWFGGNEVNAPGADDNASGISTVTEALRVLVESDYKPSRTIKFMAYAAEEVGLKGSKEIANKHKADGINVVGVMQLDMTNFDGTNDADIVLISDYTNRQQNEFIGKLIDTYVKVPWAWSKCGYACSDHASWTNAGFPASIPFEAKKEDMNRQIHTANDLLRNMRGNANHAQKFAKLAVAYMVELAK